MVGRDDKGRFMNGHPKTGGRSKKSVEERCASILREEIDPEKFRALVNVAYSRGMKGDYSFLKLLFDHMIGPPVERKELTGLDAGPIVLKVIYDD